MESSHSVLAATNSISIKSKFISLPLPAFHSLMLSQDKVIPATVATQEVDPAHMGQKGPFRCGYPLQSPRVPAGQLSSGTTLSVARSLLLESQPRQQDLSSSAVAATMQSHQCFTGTAAGMLWYLLLRLVLQLMKNSQPQPEHGPFPQHKASETFFL